MPRLTPEEILKYKLQAAEMTGYKKAIADQIANGGITPQIIEKIEYDLITRLFSPLQRGVIANLFSHRWSLVGVTEFVLQTKTGNDEKDGWYDDQIVMNVHELPRGERGISGGGYVPKQAIAKARG